MIEESILPGGTIISAHQLSQPHSFRELGQQAKQIIAAKYAEWRNVMTDYDRPVTWGENFGKERQFQLEDLHRFGHSFAHEFVGNVLANRQAAQHIRSALDGFFREAYGAQFGNESQQTTTQDQLIQLIPEAYRHVYHDVTGIITTYAQDRTLQRPPGRIIFSTPDSLVDNDYLPREYSQDTFLCIYGSDHSLPPAALRAGPDRPQMLHRAGAVYFVHSSNHPVESMDKILLSSQHPEVPSQNISLISHINFTLQDIGRLFIGDRTGVHHARIADNSAHRTQIVHLGRDFFGYDIPNTDARKDSRIPETDLRKPLIGTEESLPLNESTLDV